MNYKNSFKRLVKFDSEIARSKNEYCFVGIDEVGRGALAGPVIACAFSWKESILNLPKEYSKLFHKLNDSKQLTSKDRDSLFNTLTIYGDYALGHASVLEIEQLNILQATYLAMKRAFDEFLPKRCNKQSPFLLIDGNKFNPFINCVQIPIIDGDTKSSLIASASIIAKVYRDSLMNRISRDKKYKSFGWYTNVGYGTNAHCKAIKKYGLTPLHRKLFVRKILAGFSYA